jgi:hypothetical protein
MRLVAALTCLLVSCVESTPTPGALTRVTDPGLTATSAIPKGWQSVQMTHFSFFVPWDWERIPAKGGAPASYWSAEDREAVYGGTYSSEDELSEAAQAFVSSGREWGDTLDGLPAVYRHGSTRFDNNEYPTTVVVARDGVLRHFLACVHVDADKITPTCRRVFGSFRIVR